MNMSQSITVDSSNIIDIKNAKCPSQPESVSLEPGTYKVTLTSSLKYSGNGLPVKQLCLFVGQGTINDEVFLIAEVDRTTYFSITNTSNVFAFAVDQYLPDDSGSATVTFTPA